MPSEIGKLEAERAELDVILSSGEFGRANNHVRLLTFVCEKYFEDALDDVKEYSIAVDALGRPESFDPQVDTIVRVTAHALRKRLEEYYRTTGSQHPVQICLPPGHYVPKFIHKGELNGQKAQQSDENPGTHSSNGDSSKQNGFAEAQHNNPVASASESLARDEMEAGQQRKPAKKLKFPIRGLKTRTIVLSSAVVLAVLAWIYKWNGASPPGSVPKTLAAGVPAPMGVSTKALHFLAADNIAPYIDRGGTTWERDHFCSGGNSFSVTGHVIQGTEDPELFSTGRRGIFHCSYPLPPGTYELHLLFAETSGLQEASRSVGFSINGGPPANLDVVDDAGGDDIATAKVITDVVPESDGTIHVDFANSEAFLNAVEIVPGTPHRMVPIRIVTGHSPYRDSSGNVWVPDRYFFGGRLSSFGGDLSKVPDGHLYDWHRFGHFHYVVPVASGGKYTLKLHFVEHWFGVQNGGIGGVGSRVFDVSCNGTTLLKGFDIFREAGSLPLVKTFPHIEPTPQGKIEIYFTPAVNYPSISAIEVIPEQ